MDIGEEQPAIVIEPIPIPVPGHKADPTPSEPEVVVPETVPAEPELVPA